MAPYVRMRLGKISSYKVFYNNDVCPSNKEYTEE